MGPKERPFTVELSEGSPDDEKSRLALAYVQSIMDKHAEEIAEKVTKAMVDLALYGSTYVLEKP